MERGYKVIYEPAAGEKTIVWSAGADEADFQKAARMLSNLPTTALTSYSVPLPRFADAWDAFRAGDRLKVLVEISTRNGLIESEGTAV